MQYRFKNVIFQRISKGATVGNQCMIANLTAYGKTESAVLEELQKKFKGDTIKIKSYELIS